MQHHNHPSVSVIIPAYNAERFISETIDSIIASTYDNYEIVVMDDGSSDHTYTIVQQYADKYTHIRVLRQQNAGACVARNNAIAAASGEYILPVDADDLISADFISDAVGVFSHDPEVSVVAPTSHFIGERTGEWRLPNFDIHLLARKNIMNATAMYRKADWERVGGYCESIIAREDWEFWISILKDGGKVVRLPKVGLYYRIHKSSKRISDRKLKRHVVNTLNQRHPEFFERELGGPLRINRSWSRTINRISRFFNPRKSFCNPEHPELKHFIKALPVLFDNQGVSIYKGRNELKEFDKYGITVVVKSYRIPHLLNRLVYHFFRKPKAVRSYEYAELLRSIGVGSPKPLGYCITSSLLLLGRSYFVCLKSECPFTYRNFADHQFNNHDHILKAIAKATATLHTHNILHKDYSAGNILFKDSPDDVAVEIIDLNRIRFGKVSIEDGCKNFERLPGDDSMLRTLSDEYARLRNADPDNCWEIIRTTHKR